MNEPGELPADTGNPFAGFSDADWADWVEQLAREHEAEQASVPGESLSWMDADLPAQEAPIWPFPIGDEHAPALDEIEAAAFAARRAGAAEWRLIADVVRDASARLTAWVGPAEAVGEPGTENSGRPGVSAEQRDRDRRALAVRAAIADIAVRLHLSEQVIHARAQNAAILQERCPQLWAAFSAGHVAEQNAVTAATLAASLPGEQPGAWEAFDAVVSRTAARMTPTRFRTTARIARERAHADSIQERHRRAAVDRDVWLTPEVDGMTSLTALLPATDAAGLMARLDAHARGLREVPGETRTLSQLRADVLACLEPCGEGPTSTGPASAEHGAPCPRSTIAITIPALALLGESEEPATLDGYGPIDLDAARALAADAPSWIRVLTHPVDGTVLDIDRRAYRVPTDLARWVRTIHPRCVFPGCNRPSAQAELDHTLAWVAGGRTAADNLAPLCGHHHRLKTETSWRLQRSAGDANTRGRPGDLVWTSPTGHAETVADDPPF